MPHLGNYVGANRPARLQRFTLETAATWLAAGLDPDKVWFYRQSDIPEILELTWLLTCIAGKGLLNRAHAYKAAVDKNAAGGQNPVAGVTMGLFMYRVLMAADILMFQAHSFPRRAASGGRSTQSRARHHRTVATRPKAASPPRFERHRVREP